MKKKWTIIFGIQLMRSDLYSTFNCLDMTPLIMKGY